MLIGLRCLLYKCFISLGGNEKEMENTDLNDARWRWSVVCFGLVGEAEYQRSDF